MGQWISLLWHCNFLLAINDRQWRLLRPLPQSPQPVVTSAPATASTPLASGACAWSVAVAVSVADVETNKRIEWIFRRVLAIKIGERFVQGRKTKRVAGIFGRTTCSGTLVHSSTHPLTHSPPTHPLTHSPTLHPLNTRCQLAS